jgi:putative transposase
MITPKSSRWNVPRGIDRSAYYITVKQTVSQSMSVCARDSDSVLATVILASLTNSYVEGSAGFTSVSGQTVRNHLKRQDPSRFVRMSDDVVMKLRSAGALSKKKCILAIDTHDIMYYGDPDAEGVTGTQHKKGTHWAYKFGSISVLLGGEKLTLAAIPVMHEPRVEHVKILIEHVISLGIKPKIVILDGAYNSAGVINYLNNTGMKYIIRIAAPLKSIKPGDDFTYRTRGNRRRKEEQATFRLVAVKGRDRGGRVRLFVFATNTKLKARRIRRLFRKRWAIETSYRMINKFLARTTSKRHALRILYFYLAMLLYNLWVMLNYHEHSRRIIADSLKVYVVLAVIMATIPDMEKAP